MLSPILQTGEELSKIWIYRCWWFTQYLRDLFLINIRVSICVYVPSSACLSTSKLQHCWVNGGSYRIQEDHDRSLQRLSCFLKHRNISVFVSHPFFLFSFSGVNFWTSREVVTFIAKYYCFDFLTVTEQYSLFLTTTVFTYGIWCCAVISTLAVYWQMTWCLAAAVCSELCSFKCQ